MNIQRPKCPVCDAWCEQGRSADYGERQQNDCPRCGPFEITRTALAMLGSRLEEEKNVKARLSHAIRSQTSEENWLLVDSKNLDEFLKVPLPDIEQQIRNFLQWMADRLGDDHLGRIEVPNYDHLTAVIGVVDTGRLGRLLQHMEEKKLISHSSSKQKIGLTPTAWELLENNQGGRRKKVKNIKVGFENLLHEEIVNASMHHYHDGDYRNAVMDAVTAIFDKIRERTGEDLDGAKLVTKVLAPNNSPMLIVGDLKTESGRNEQAGLMDMLKGFYQGVRNPKAHSLLSDLTEITAAQYLVTASLLMRRVCEAETANSQDTEDERQSA